MLPGFGRTAETCSGDTVDRFPSGNGTFPLIDSPCGCTYEKQSGISLTTRVSHRRTIPSVSPQVGEDRKDAPGNNTIDGKIM